MEAAPTLLWISQLENKNMTEVSQCLDFEKKQIQRPQMLWLLKTVVLIII